MLDRFKAFWQGVVLAPIVNLLLRLGVSPDAVTLVGTVGVVAGAVVFFPQGWLFAGVLVITAFVFSDLNDGTMARRSGRTSSFGAFLDSTLDRASEGIVLTAVAFQFSDEGKDWAVAATVLAVLSSVMVSYTRARAEALGIKGDVGIAPRAIRVVILSIGLLFAKGASLGDFELLEPAVYVLAALSLITVFQRIFFVRGQLRET